MKLRFSNQRNQALTLVEVLVVIVVLAVLATMFLPIEPGVRPKAYRIYCVNNLHQIGLAYKSWAGDNNDKFPMEVSVTNGGTLGLGEGRNTWINFLVMSNELSTPKVLFCPADKERFPPATSFSADFVSKISYFVGLDASTNYPQALLSGDDNFEINGVPVKSGLLQLSTNHATAWTAARHKLSGDIGLADGSAQQLSNSGLTNFLHQTGLANNRLAIP